MELRQRIKREAEIPTASMADIAFLLIIFFMVSTVFSSEVGLQIILPEKGGIVKVKSENIAKVYIDKDGSVRIQGEPVKVAEIATIARRMLAENDKLIFSIKTHPDANYEYLISVFDQLRLANAERISFAPSGGKR